MSIFKLYLYILLTNLLALSACTKYSEDNAMLICGVPVKGTPWQLAAAIHDTGDQTFLPESVTQLTFQDGKGKAYIEGYIYTQKLLQHPENDYYETIKPFAEDPNDEGILPAQVICDTQDGKVTHALLYCEIIETQK